MRRCKYRHLFPAMPPPDSPGRVKQMPAASLRPSSGSPAGKGGRLRSPRITPIESVTAKSNTAKAMDMVNFEIGRFAAGNARSRSQNVARSSDSGMDRRPSLTPRNQSRSNRGGQASSSSHAPADDRRAKSQSTPWGTWAHNNSCTRGCQQSRW